MSNSFGVLYRLTVFGESHGPGLGLVIDGLPAGIKIDFDLIDYELERRRPGKSDLASPRKEKDRYRILSGEKDGYTSGTALTFFIENTDARPGDYEALESKPRPGHADYPAHVRYRGYHNTAGSGQFSGRLTAPQIIAGAIAKSILAGQGIAIKSRIKQIHKIKDIDLDYRLLSSQDFFFADIDFPVFDREAQGLMKEEILAAKNKLDSLGGLVETLAFGLPAGIGQPLFDKLDGRLAYAIMNIASVKGIEFGLGFNAGQAYGSQNNDPYYLDQGVKTKSNNHGGVLGGLSSAMPLVFTTAIKPTSSIGLVQDTVDLKNYENCQIQIKGRHDPCIVPRVIPVIEAWTAISILDLMMIGGFYEGPEK